MSIWNYFGVVHKAVYKLSDGRMGARMGWIDVALVETTGRKTGKKRTIPIACYPHKDSIAVSASNSGSDRHPAWYLNMMANPSVSVRLGKERFSAHAEVVPDAERVALWQQIVDNNKHQGEYLQRTSRKIPLVWLKRV
ncbi:MAG: nitroreductase family deazaflavin-dependent oxidoreductase [Halieaceae bacterium]|jgi:F420H(2)-dependent quinone reductase|nr:nitroreductase family deazaflavin-dependent oxidoreductase [Halieaceae bacterium]